MILWPRQKGARHERYLETLLLYYEEEVEGEAYFTALAARFSDPDQVEKLTLVAQVEGHAAQAIAPLIAQHGLTPRATADLVRAGQRDAADTPADWAQVIAEMNQSYPGYLADFQALEAITPPPDCPRTAFMTEHEVAALEFLRLEAFDPGNSSAPLKAYLSAAPEEV